MGGPWRSRRCTGRVVGSDSHYKRDFTRAARGSQRPRALARGDVCGSTRSGRPDVSFATKVWVGGQRCAGRVAASDSLYKRQFTRAARGSQRPRSRQRRRLRTRSRRPDVSFATRPPPRGPGRQPRARCVRRAALGRRASNSASPPSLGRAPIPPDSSISKSGPRILEFEYPGVVFNIEWPRYKMDTRGDPSTTEGCSRRGFALALR